jgi:hypothetical protein
MQMEKGNAALKQTEKRMCMESMKIENGNAMHPSEMIGGNQRGLYYCVLPVI